MEDYLEIALFQAPLAWQDPGANRAYFSARLAALPRAVDLVVLPEMFTTGFTMDPGSVPESEARETMDWMSRESARYGCALMGSIAMREGDGYVNRGLTVTPEGPTHVYDKRHTFTLAGEDRIYRAGKEKRVFGFRGFRICPMICYDLRFPVWSRNVEDYDLLVYVANWPQPRIAAWDALLQARAIENMAYVIGVNRIGTDKKGHEYPGHSAVYDPMGERQLQAEGEADAIVRIGRSAIEGPRKKLRFLEDRDRFTLEP